MALNAQIDFLFISIEILFLINDVISAIRHHPSHGVDRSVDICYEEVVCQVINNTQDRLEISQAYIIQVFKQAEWRGRGVFT